MTRNTTLGIALLLFGNILAVDDAVFFLSGLLIGFIGLWLVITDKSK